MDQNTVTQIKEGAAKNLREISDDIRALRSHVLAPFTEFQNLHWLKDRKFMLISAFGLVPLFTIILFGSSGSTLTAYWALALYFSAFWAFFFYSQFAPENVKKEWAISSFCITAFLSISVLLYVMKIPPFSWIRHGGLGHNDFSVAIAYIFGVGIPEEACKLAVVYWLMRKSVHQRATPDLIMFYGLMSGLGFGIYEGIEYQTGFNTQYDSSSAYLLNMLRLTSLPFLHAIWTSIAAYYLSLTVRYPTRKKGLFLMAVCVPGVIHGLYDFANANVFGMVIAFLSVYFMNYYRTVSKLESAEINQAA